MSVASNVSGLLSIGKLAFSKYRREELHWLLIYGVQRFCQQRHCKQCNDNGSNSRLEHANVRSGPF